MPEWTLKRTTDPMLSALNAPLRKIPVWVVYLIGLVPLGLMINGVFANTLGADPVAALEHQTGIWALRFLIAALVITPLLRITRLNLIKFRRALGLLGFLYVVAHLLVWTWLDHFFAWGRLWEEILKRPYITIGMAAFVMLIPLAITSNDWSVRKLSASAWRKIHWWAYVATAFGAIHFMLVVKRWPPEPMIYCAIVAGLLGWRFVSAQRKKRRAEMAGISA